MPMRIAILAALVAIPATALGAETEPIAAAATRALTFTPPADAGIIDVRDHGAVGDGRSDDTAALRAAIAASARYGFFRPFVYLPRGTYLVSGGLEVEGRFFAIIGEHRHETVIRLQDGAAGFDDPSQPRPLFELGGGPNNNQAFGNYVHNLTLDTGGGNPGAVGLRYKASNYGATTELTIRSGDGAGVAGLLLDWGDPGPEIHRNLHIVGFDHGVRSTCGMFGPVFENVLLEDQRRAAIYNRNQCLWLRRIHSRNAVPAVVNAVTESKDTRPECSMVLLVESLLEGGAAEAAAIERHGGMLRVRETEVRGYGSALRGPEGETIDPGTIAHHTSHPALAAAGEVPAERALRLPVREHPHAAYDPPADWVNVCDFGAVADGETDCTPGIQAAIDSGATTIYFPKDKGVYLLHDTVHLRGRLRRVVGMRSLIGMDQATLGEKPAFRFDGDQEQVIIEHLHLIHPDKRSRGQPQCAWEHAAPGTLVIQHSLADRYQNTPGAGPVFIMDNCAAPLLFEHPQEAWLRSINPEGIGAATPQERAQVEQRGGRLWILGAKTEGGYTFLHAYDGAQTEVLGGFHYPAQGFKRGQVPLYRIEDAQAALTFAETAHGRDRWSRRHDVMVREVQGDAVHEAEREALPKDLRFLKYGRVVNVPLYVAGEAP